MTAQDYLTLRLVRLKHPEERLNTGEGLTFVFPKGGAGEFVSGSNTQKLASGDILVIGSTLKGKLQAPPGGEMLFWIFSMNFEHLFPLFGGNEICLVHTVTDGFKSPRHYAGNTSVARFCHNLLEDAPSHFNLDHRGQLLRVVTAILSQEFENARGKRVGFIRVEDRIAQIFETLSVEELLNMSVGELADRFNCSRRHLNRLFHQHFGFSVASLRMEMRLMKAVSLLRDPDAKIINVAEQCGFNHLGLFNTCFKRRFGESPGQWRKQLNQPEKQPMGLPMETQFSAGANGATPCPLRANGMCQWPGALDRCAAEPLPDDAEDFSDEEAEAELEIRKPAKTAKAEKNGNGSGLKIQIHVKP